MVFKEKKRPTLMSNYYYCLVPLMISCLYIEDCCCKPVESPPTNHRIQFVGMRNGYGGNVTQATLALENNLRMITGDHNIRIETIDPTGASWYSENISKMEGCPEGEIRKLLATLKSPDNQYTREFKMFMTEDFEPPKNVIIHLFGPCENLGRKRGLQLRGHTMEDVVTTDNSTESSTTVTDATDTGATTLDSIPTTTTEPPPSTTISAASEISTSLEGIDTTTTEQSSTSTASPTTTTTTITTTTTAFSNTTEKASDTVTGAIIGSLTEATSDSSTTGPSVTASSTTTVTAEGAVSESASTTSPTTTTTTAITTTTTTTTTTTMAAQIDNNSADNRSDSDGPSLLIDKTTSIVSDLKFEGFNDSLKIEDEPTTTEAATQQSVDSAAPTASTTVNASDNGPYYGKYIGLSAAFLIFVAYIVCSRAYKKQGMYELHNE